MNPNQIVIPDTVEDIPVFKTRRQWKAHMARVHNAEYEERKANPELYRVKALREAVTDTVKGFKEGLGI